MEYFSKQASKLFMTTDPAQIVGYLIDIKPLKGLDRRLTNDGDLIPIWIYWWLTLAAELSMQQIPYKSAVLI